MSNIRRFLDRLMEFVNAVAFAILTILAVWQVVTRYFLNNPSTWSEELAAYLFSWVTLLGAAYVFGKRGHMNIPVVVERFTPENQKILAIINEIVVLLFAVFVMIWGGSNITSLSMGQMSSSLGVPMGYFYAAVPVSGVFIALYNILNLVDLFQMSAKDFVKSGIASDGGVNQLETQEIADITVEEED